MKPEIDIYIYIYIYRIVNLNIVYVLFFASSQTVYEDSTYAFFSFVLLCIGARVHEKSSCVVCVWFLGMIQAKAVGSTKVIQLDGQVFRMLLRQPTFLSRYPFVMIPRNDHYASYCMYPRRIHPVDTSRYVCLSFVCIFPFILYSLPVQL
jgi:hypothetical protein